MNAGNRKNGIGCLDIYQASLERRIQQGEWDLVCRDEELCKEVETRLSVCNPQDFYSKFGEDMLSAIEDSLQASHHTMGQRRINRLAKAFEVLELAALNLYLCPWRKEYKVVKTFSGVFTHCIKPALPAQQAKDLFALLGYQPSGSSEDELRLGAKPVLAQSLLQLACSFFTARIECQLLLRAMASLGGSMEWVLHLIQERKQGSTFQKALDSAKSKLESAPCESPLALDANLDLYTDSTLSNCSHMASPPSLPYIPPTEVALAHKLSRTRLSQSTRDKNLRSAQTVSFSSLNCQIKAMPEESDSTEKPCDSERQFPAVCNALLSASKDGHHLCNCSKIYNSSFHLCLQCEECHNVDCPYFKSCTEQRHEIIFAQQALSQMEALSHTGQNWKHSLGKPPKKNLKQHDCTSQPSNDFFRVCYDCCCIHDLQCKELASCLSGSHNVKNTGRIQPAQIERQVTAHTCFKEENPNYAVCHTCNKSHGLLCNELQSCHNCDHTVSYQLEDNANQANPMSLHDCCKNTKPHFACLTCRAFHAGSCSDYCSIKHEVQKLESSCRICSNSETYILCMYCCAQLCKTCWFKSPLNCKCGMPFINTAV